MIPRANIIFYDPYVAGWGQLEEDGKNAEVLQEVQLPIVDNTVCRNMYREQSMPGFTDDKFDDSVLCAGK